MTDKEKIRETISGLIIPESDCKNLSLMEKGRQYAYREILDIIDSMSEELIMKVIVTIKKGNKDPENFTRELEMTPQECEYLQETARVINHNGEQQYLGVFVHQI